MKKNKIKLILTISLLVLFCTTIIAGCGKDAAFDKANADSTTPKKEKKYTGPAFKWPQMLDNIDKKSKQMVFVLGANSDANIWLLSKRENKWQVDMGPFYAKTGVNGMGKESKGDKKTPLGVYNLGKAYGWGDNATKYKWAGQEIKSGDIWVTDPRSQAYNQYRSRNAEDVDWQKFEFLNDFKYVLCLDMGNNPKNEPEKDKSLFLYAWLDSEDGTDGGIAMADADMVRLLNWLDPESNPQLGIFKAGDVNWKCYQPLPEGFVFLRDALKNTNIKEYPAYATNDNFLGRPADGYETENVVVSKKVAIGLKKASKSLESKGYGLLVYDGYRPKRATQDFLAWSRDKEDLNRKEENYPEIDKPDLIGTFIARNSPHNRGAAVDITIYNLENGENLDMGSEFDFFGSISNYNSKEVTAEQKANRKLLRETMIEAGFRPYDVEWWHFNLEKEPFPKTAFDFVIAYPK